MIGYLFLYAHQALKAVTDPIRQRRFDRAFAAQRALSDAKDVLRRARQRKDTRSIHQAEAEVYRARTAQLRAEMALPKPEPMPRGVAR